MKMRMIGIILVIAMTMGYGSLVAEELVVYSGASDSSAAVSVGKDSFIVADDENNMLRVYSLSKPGKVVGKFSMDGFLDADPGRPEADLEGAATIGDKTYWITSHGRNKNGKLRLGRHCLFAVKMEEKANGVSVEPVGKVYRRLLHDLVSSDVGKKFGLEKITELNNPEKKKLAPKKDGVNIEALASGPNGSLYIGFRNPLIKDGKIEKALIVRLVNPEEVIENNAKAIFDEGILMDLGKRGLRSMEYNTDKGVYYILAGDKDSGNKFSIYTWDGKIESEPVEKIKLGDAKKFNPEAMFVHEGFLLLLSDDGTVEVEVRSIIECKLGEILPGNKCPNKFLVDDTAKTFRMKKIKLTELD